VVSVISLTGVPEVRPGDDLAALLGDAVERAAGLEDGDVLVVAQKAVSKAEGRVEQTDDVVEAILREARAVRRRRGGLVIAETKHGFVCASAGVDRSNAPGEGWIVLLPEDPDASAAGIRAALGDRFGHQPTVIVSDSFGRAWRQGTTDVAIGVAGMRPLLDLRGEHDARGYELSSPMIAVAAYTLYANVQENKAQVLASTKLAGPGETVETTVKVPAKAGSYPYMCTFPGHFAAGMKGTLVVK